MPSAFPVRTASLGAHRPSTGIGAAARGFSTTSSISAGSSGTGSGSRRTRRPASAKARPNPREDWVIQDVCELRIIEDVLWNDVKARQKHIRHELTHDDAGVRSERARRPVYLLSNLIKCGVCSGGFSKVSDHHYGCSNARNRGTCENRSPSHATCSKRASSHVSRPI